MNDRAQQTGRRYGAWRAGWRRFRRNRLAVAALGFILLQAAAAAGAQWLAPYNPYQSDFTVTWQKPSVRHWCGTDDLGRDVFSRLLYGARISLSVGVLSQLAAALVGLPLGAWAGLRGGRADYLVMRLIDVLSSLPAMLFYILLLVSLGAGFGNMILALAATGWIGLARLVRGQVLTLKETDYVRAARAMGASTRHIITTHLLGNALSPVIVALALGIPGAMLAEASLSFLGVGVPPPHTSWGQMIGAYQIYLRTAWHLTVFPALTLALTMLAWFLLADGLRLALNPLAGDEE